jgi:hypothetical protein
MHKFDEFTDATQFDPETKRFRKMYAGCKTCIPIAQIRLEPEKLSFFQYISQWRISLRLSRL